MPWYRSGTVAVTSGSTTVTGTGTSFAASSRVGDAFQGPDGHWYEVTNIASASVLSILPAYQGANASAGAYALAPMQGYVKESADRLRQLIDQWGATLAGLGPLSSVAVAPVANGGTGGTTPTAARAGLGLGSAATANAGTAMGNVMPVGAFGLGSQFNPGLTRLSDASGVEIYPTGFYRYDTSTISKPTFGSGFGALIELSALFSGGANYGGQIAVDYATSEMGFRCLAGASGFSTWRKIYHDGNTTRAADGTLKAI